MSLRIFAPSFVQQFTRFYLQPQFVSTAPLRLSLVLPIRSPGFWPLNHFSRLRTTATATLWRTSAFPIRPPRRPSSALDYNIARIPFLTRVWSRVLPAAREFGISSIQPHDSHVSTQYGLMLHTIDPVLPPGRPQDHNSNSIIRDCGSASA